jgi:hypothetical protein
MRAPIATSGLGGEVAEWSNVPDSKSGVGLRPPWVRIPPSPPLQRSHNAGFAGVVVFAHRLTRSSVLPLPQHQRVGARYPTVAAYSDLT